MTEINLKQDILTELIQSLLTNYDRLINASITDEAVAADEDRYMCFARNNEHLIRVMMVESLKVTDEEPVIFSILETLMSNVAEDSHHQERLMAEFFTNIMPAMSYICYRSAWSDKYQTSIKDQDETFNKLLRTTHGYYHKAME